MQFNAIFDQLQYQYNNIYIQTLQTNIIFFTYIITINYSNKNIQI